jgi:hypothetical protein
MKNFNPNFTFLIVFATTTTLTLFSGGCAIRLSANDNLTPHQTRVFETCNTTWNMGIGAIFGLLGSKAADLLDAADNRDNQP